MPMTMGSTKFMTSSLYLFPPPCGVGSASSTLCGGMRLLTKWSSSRRPWKSRKRKSTRKSNSHSCKLPLTQGVSPNQRSRQGRIPKPQVSAPFGKDCASGEVCALAKVDCAGRGREQVPRGGLICGVPLKIRQEVENSSSSRPGGLIRSA